MTFQMLLTNPWTHWVHIVTSVYDDFDASISKKVMFS